MYNRWGCGCNNGCNMMRNLGNTNGYIIHGYLLPMENSNINSWPNEAVMGATEYLSDKNSISDNTKYIQNDADNYMNNNYNNSTVMGDYYTKSNNNGSAVMGDYYSKSNNNGSAVMGDYYSKSNNNGSIVAGETGGKTNLLNEYMIEKDWG